MGFKGKVAIVTGGATGIGRAVAEGLLKGGASVVLNGRREDRLRQTAQELDPSGDRTAVVAGDIGFSTTARNIARVAAERFGGIDILVNSAGIFSSRPFLETGEDELDSLFRTIIKGAFFAAQAAIPEMIKRGRGSIVNISTLAVNQAMEALPMTAYATVKAGIHALTSHLAVEFASHHIRVNAVAPGVVDTPINAPLFASDESGQLFAAMSRFHPLGRMGKALDVAGAILFLAGDDADWITGIVMPVDGGLSAGRPAG